MTNYSPVALAAVLSAAVFGGACAFSPRPSGSGVTLVRGSSSVLRMALYPETAEDILWTPSIKSGERDEKYGPIGKYCEDLNTVIRRKTRTVECGPIKFGSDHPIVRQTMSTVTTGDVTGSIDQRLDAPMKGSTW